MFHRKHTSAPIRHGGSIHWVLARLGESVERHNARYPAFAVALTISTPEHETPEPARSPYRRTWEAASRGRHPEVVATLRAADPDTPLGAFSSELTLTKRASGCTIQCTARTPRAFLIPLLARVNATGVACLALAAAVAAPWIAPSLIPGPFSSLAAMMLMASLLSIAAIASVCGFWTRPLRHQFPGLHRFSDPLRVLESIFADVPADPALPRSPVY